MAIWGDYHTHTVYSHGKGTVEENVLVALSRGLKEIAITDHGFKHMTYNIRRMDWPYIKKDVERMRIKYPQIKILLGIESNFNSVEGNIDVLPSDFEELDLIVCGYHKFVKPDRFSDSFKFWLPNFILDTFRTSTVKQTNKNTDTYIKALEKNEIDIVAHPNYGIKTDVVEIAKACKHFGTYFELNGKKISMTDDEIARAAETGVEFICDSDAHSSDRVCDCALGITTAERLGIPMSQIANWERFPDFRSRKVKEKIKSNELLL